MLETAPANGGQASTIGGLAKMTSDIVGAYVIENSVPLADLPSLIRSVHDTLSDLGRPASAYVAPELAKPAVPVRKSITDTHIISLEDGKPYKTLKRHLKRLGLTPGGYRAKWGLPADYPLVAPAYAQARSALAKEMGFGQGRRRR